MTPDERRAALLARLQESPATVAELERATGAQTRRVQDLLAELKVQGAVEQRLVKTPSVRRGLGVWHLVGEREERIEAVALALRSRGRSFVGYGALRREGAA